MKLPLHLKNKIVYLSLGSNIGNSFENINKSIDLLSTNTNITFLKKSSYYNTEPLYNTNQDNFVNIVIKLSTNITVLELLKFCNNIEIIMGRNINDIKNYPRVIDIDILVYGEAIIKSKKLIIPHPKIAERKFVLQPWLDIDSNFIVPGINKKIKLLLKNVKDNSKIIKLDL